MYYGAYVFFEKTRVIEQKVTSKKRLEVEEIHSMHGGMDTESEHQYSTVVVGTPPHLDRYGRVNVY